jgi:hypothetical protein
VPYRVVPVEIDLAPVGSPPSAADRRHLHAAARRAPRAVAASRSI